MVAISVASVVAVLMAGTEAGRAATPAAQNAGANPAQPAAGAASDNSAAAAQDAAKNKTPDHFDIDEFRVDGADAMPQMDLETAVYPFLGPHRTASDVEKARAALEKAYHDKGYQTVSVAVPPQNVDGRVIVLKVTESKIGAVRVKNSRYFDLAKIKEKAPSLKEGTLPNFNDVTKDIAALNQWPDRRVTPALRAGVAPGTIDVDLNVEDKPPVHANLEINNRQSPSTTEERVSGTVHYDDLWQLGHSLSFSFQVAPERPSDATVFSGSYLAHATDFVSFLFYGLTSNSDVASVGGTDIVGPGQTIGTRAVISLPSQDNFFHTLSIGPDYKNYGQVVNLGTDSFSTPVTYYPVVATYSATWQGQGQLAQLNTSVTFNLRGLGSGYDDFDAKRYDANASFYHLNADLSYTQDLSSGYQFFAKAQGQIADGPLVSSEQFALGGFDTVRGYLETETLGDNGVAGTVEFRSPDIGGWLQSKMKDETGQGSPRYTTFNEWRLFAFGDGGYADIYDPLPGQQAAFAMASYGFGTRFKAFNALNGMVAFAMPAISQTYTHANDPRVLFRVWGEF